MARVNDQLGAIWHVFSHCEENERRLLDEQHQVSQLRQALTEYEALDVDLGLLQGKLRFLDVRVGTVVGGDVPRLRESLGLLGYSLSVFMETDGTSHVVAAGLAGAGGALERVLKAAAFRQLALPREFQDRPSRLREQLQSRWRQVADALQAHEHPVQRKFVQASAKPSWPPPRHWPVRHPTSSSSIPFMGAAAWSGSAAGSPRTAWRHCAMRWPTVLADASP